MEHKNLIEPKDINTLIEEQVTLETAFKGDKLSRRKFSFSGKSARFIRDLDGMLDQNTVHIDFMTAGNLSLHNIIEFILDKYGACLSMYISTWAVKEAAARTLRKLHDDKLIGRIYGVFDYRTESIDAKSFQLIEPIFNQVVFTKNHAKVILIEYEDIYFTILTSANMSNNPRIEAGFISLSPLTFYFHKSWMIDVFNGKKVY